MRFSCLLLFVTTFHVAAVGKTAGEEVQSVVVHHFVFFGDQRERLRDPNFLATPALEGAQLYYDWCDLQSGPDTYDFTAIQQDLDFLSRHGKRLFVQLEATTFDPARTAVPTYLLKDPQYDGGVVDQFEDDGRPSGKVVMLWHPRVRREFQKLLKALGQAFDGKIEGVNLQETAIGVVAAGKPLPAGFTPAVYRAAIESNLRALSASFHRSVTMQYMNFMPGEWLPDEDHGYLRSVFKCAADCGVGIGAPDLMPMSKPYHNHIYRLMHERSASLAIGIAVQDGNYLGKTNDMTVPESAWPNLVPSLTEFAVNHLRVTYIFWGAQAPFFSHDVVTAFRTQGGPSRQPAKDVRP